MGEAVGGQRLGPREVLGAARAVVLPEATKDKVVGRAAKPATGEGSLSAAKIAAGPGRTESAGVAAPGLCSLPSPCRGPEKWEMGEQFMWSFLCD